MLLTSPLPVEFVHSDPPSVNGKRNNTVSLGKLFITCCVPRSMWFRAKAKAGCLSFPTELKTARPTVQIRSHYHPPHPPPPCPTWACGGGLNTRGEDTALCPISGCLWHWRPWLNVHCLSMPGPCSGVKSSLVVGRALSSHFSSFPWGRGN